MAELIYSQITRITQIQNKKNRESTFRHSGSMGGGLCFEANEIQLENDSARTQAGIMKSEFSGSFAAMVKKYFLSFLAVILFEAGCSTEPAKRDDAGLATVSALVVALPLIPFVLPYSAIEQAKDRKKDEALYRQLDPVYQKRIEMINARSPKADADEAYKENAIAFLPTIPNGDIYCGLDKSEYDAKEGQQNQQRINSSRLLTYLQTLLSDAPLQAQVRIWNQQYHDFLQTRWNYEKAFNLEMNRLIQDAKSPDAK